MVTITQVPRTELPEPPVYNIYHYFCSDNEQYDTRAFSKRDYEYVGAEYSKGLTEVQALILMNLWNKGTHHRYRYWIEN